MDLRQGLLYARLDRCRKERTRTDRRDEKEGWLAEEEGLRDSLLGRQRADLIRLCYLSHVERYQLGFHDGGALHCASLSPARPHNINHKENSR